MGEPEVRRLVQTAQLRTVPPDPETALGELAISRRHIASARTVLADDPTLAFVALYDAMRKAMNGLL